MNRPLFIIIGSVVILILLLVWVYVLFIRGNLTEDNNTGTSGIFSNLDLEDTSIDSDDFEDEQTETTGSTTEQGDERKKLRQLTIKNVAGFSEINASTSDVVYFIETGVGHIYEVDIFSGQERRISARTFPDAYKGDVSDDGQHFILQTGFSSNRTTHVGKINPNEQTVDDVIELESNVVDFSFLSDSKLGYAVLGNNSIQVRSYDLTTETKKDLFSIPFREARLVWGKEENGPHYFFPKPAEGLEGFTFEYVNGSTKRLPLDGFAFSSYGAEKYVLATYVEEAKYQTKVYSRETLESERFVRPVLTDKCLETSDLSIICGIDSRPNLGNTDLINWYKGIHRFSDDIYMLDVANQQSVELANALAITGRTVDITKLKQGSKYDYIYFINKNDQTLWIFEYEQQKTEETTDSVEE